LRFPGKFHRDCGRNWKREVSPFTIDSFQARSSKLQPASKRIFERCRLTDDRFSRLQHAPLQLTRISFGFP
jgi:hypothetical protein